MSCEIINCKGADIITFKDTMIASALYKMKRYHNMNIKGLYFKLNIEKPLDEEIYRFFTMEAEKKNINKIDLLYNLIIFYKMYQNIKEGAKGK